MIFRTYLDVLVEAQVLRAGRGHISDSAAAYYSGKVVALLPILHGCAATVIAHKILESVAVTSDIMLISTIVAFAPFAAVAIFLTHNLEYFQATERRLRSDLVGFASATRQLYWRFTKIT